MADISCSSSQDSLQPPEDHCEAGPSVLAVSPAEPEVPFRIVLKKTNVCTCRHAIAVLLSYLSTIDSQAVCGFALSGDTLAIQVWLETFFISAPPVALSMHRDAGSELVCMVEPVRAESIRQWIDASLEASFS